MRAENRAPHFGEDRLERKQVTTLVCFKKCLETLKKTERLHLVSGRMEMDL